ncbi:MAG: ATP-binding protein, partial [Chloroflexi bacterium]|nr:ATP-binding protein [Chloroflexota bacterium]
MLAKVTSCALIGLEGILIQVEVDVAHGMPSLTIVGLPDTAVKESIERVRTALRNTGLRFPNTRLTINLAPADIRKEGPIYDLPIAVGILVASEQVWPQEVEGALFIGELSLDGSVRHIPGVLPIAALARQEGLQRLFVPAVDAPEAALVDGLEVYPVENLGQLAAHLQGLARIPPYRPAEDPMSVPPPAYAADFADIRGQEHVKRALEVAAAGGHNVLMVGPPGAGKTLLARSVPSILPTMTLEEA